MATASGKEAKRFESSENVVVGNHNAIEKWT
jgi:hypothetical protein